MTYHYPQAPTYGYQQPQPPMAPPQPRYRPQPQPQFHQPVQWPMNTQKRERRFFWGVISLIGAVVSLAGLAVAHTPDKSAFAKRLDQAQAFVITTTTSTVPTNGAVAITPTTVAQASSQTTQAPTPTQAPTTTAPNPELITFPGAPFSCKPKPGMDVNAFWTSYTKGGGDPYWDYVKGQVCA